MAGMGAIFRQLRKKSSFQKILAYRYTASRLSHVAARMTMHRKRGAAQQTGGGCRRQVFFGTTVAVHTVKRRRGRHSGRGSRCGASAVSFQVPTSQPNHWLIPRR
ncbi:hypothetical protein Y032_0039g131 [Ancylostoma ceylanicum]|uniref:Uncharacterized protein n=1 Tax=Ancylostoma ceylanicum TaxID=53326 RepID=A0A016UJK7_9BILA|nr:hypothetical protein Y032_0039g131 [Ancylostoma ceylanicum]